MTDPKHTETEAERAARIKRVEDALKKSKGEKGLMPTTPAEAEAVDKLGEDMDAKHQRYLKSLTQPKPPASGAKGR